MLDMRGSNIPAAHWTRHDENTWCWSHKSQIQIQFIEIQIQIQFIQIQIQK